MKFIANRITGINCPVFGVSWTPVTLERTAAQRVIAFLEDRRVLFSPSQLEEPDRCIESILTIRERLTAEIELLANDSALSQNLRAMRAACRKFLGDIEPEKQVIIRHGGNASWEGRHQNAHWAAWKFNSAVGELRGVFGIHVAAIATQYGLDVEDELASILPRGE